MSIPSRILFEKKSLVQEFSLFPKKLTPWSHELNLKTVISKVSIQ